jgi:carboxypeptidase Q
MNLIIETKEGNQDNITMLGAHADSVEAGPGINDNGSGSIALLEVAKHLAKFRIINKVRFAWWSGEEQGLVGSTHYVSKLGEDERKKIKMYLNFDMIASPNYVYGIHGGKTYFNVTAAPGSDRATAIFEEYYKSRGLPFQSAGYGGSSDYAPFMRVGIPAGGLAPGASGKKTKQEAEKYGGVAGAPHDPNYHRKGDTVDNLNMAAFEANTKAIAHAVATFARGDNTLDKYKSP